MSLKLAEVPSKGRFAMRCEHCRRKWATHRWVWGRGPTTSIYVLSDTCLDCAREKRTQLLSELLETEI